MNFKDHTIRKLAGRRERLRLEKRRRAVMGQKESGSTNPTKTDLRPSFEAPEASRHELFFIFYLFFIYLLFFIFFIFLFFELFDRIILSPGDLPGYLPGISRSKNYFASVCSKTACQTNNYLPGISRGSPGQIIRKIKKIKKHNKKTIKKLKKKHVQQKTQNTH